MVDIESVLHENRTFPPPKSFIAQANLSSTKEYQELYQRSLEDPSGFWLNIAQQIPWNKKPGKGLTGKAPFFQWFSDGLINASVVCLDQHLTGSRRNKTAILWEGEPGDTRKITYQELHGEVCRFANVLKNLGAQKGDRVAIYMPMIPEIIVAMLACARIGATHSVIFGGFSAEALRDRIHDAQAKLVITADGGFRRGQPLALKENVDQAIDKLSQVKHVIVVQRTQQKVNWVNNRDRWYHEEMTKADANHPAEALPAEHPLFFLYTSGTTGKPKAIVHSTGGYLVQTYYTAKIIFDLQEQDIYWCTADCGWVTGHSYIVYGPLANGATTVIYEGAPNTPHMGRFWEIVQKHKVSIFYTAPTAIRTFIKWGKEHPQKYDLSSLRLLGTVGEPINPEAWMWYHKVIGNEHCPIVDTWWQTETGAILISPIPGITSTKPGSATMPFFGVHADVVDAKGNSCKANAGGFLVIKQPWPAMLRTLYQAEDRYQETYWSKYPGIYFTGDGARRDAEGNFWIMGRVDDVINVSGHRLSTMEVESALVSHPEVAEAAVVGRPDEIKGQAICAFVTLSSAAKAGDKLTATLREHVTKEIGALAKPDEIRFTDALPKTRSGKIMRRLLRDIAAGKETNSDTSTLEDYSVLAKLREEDE